MDFHERLRTIFKDIKQEEIAAKLNITQPAVSSLILGKSIPKLSTLQIICKEFNVDGNWLLLGTSSECKFLEDNENQLIEIYRLLSNENKAVGKYKLRELLKEQQQNDEVAKVGNL